MRISLIIIGSLIIITVIGFGALSYFTGIPIKSIANKITANIGLPECSDVQFTVSPIDLENFESIVPLGNLSPPAHTFPTDHIYFNFKEGVQDIPVYAPGDVTITEISSTYQSWADPPYTDYSINFSLCEGVSAYFIHVQSLTAKLQQAFDENKGGCESYETGDRAVTNCRAGVKIEVTAGEILAQTARQGQHNFDLGVYDFNQEPWAFANPDRWARNRSNYSNTRCPLDYYAGELKEKLFATLGDGNYGGYGIGVRTIEPICGTVGQDVPGTAQGVWFLKNSASGMHVGEDQHIALVHDNFDPTKGALSLGIALEDLGIPSRVYFFVPEHEGLYNRELSEIQAGSDVYCFNGQGGAGNNFYQIPILIQLVDATTIKIGKLNALDCETGPWALGQFVEFER
ncbi:hypothetical protein IID19_05735 [Patescibacteria group bacterium]|nr:hypothetical protein [Patescibacteria group bacterium]